MDKQYQAKIKQGSVVSHDFSFFNWPDCKWPKGMKPDSELIFNVEKGKGFFVLTRSGFGEISGEYGNGSLFVRHLKDLEFMECDHEYKPDDSNVLLECVKCGNIIASG